MSVVTLTCAGKATVDDALKVALLRASVALEEKDLGAADAEAAKKPSAAAPAPAPGAAAAAPGGDALGAEQARAVLFAHLVSALKAGGRTGVRASTVRALHASRKPAAAAAASDAVARSSSARSRTRSRARARPR